MMSMADDIRAPPATCGCARINDPLSDPLPDLLASDAERDRAAQILRHALSEGRLAVTEFEERLSSVYAARTRGDLQPLIADVSRQSLDGPATEAARPPARTTHGTKWVVSFMSSNRRRGRWKLADRCRVVDLMGGSHLDLTQAEMPAELRITVISLMGGSWIRVPESARVEASKLAIMGGVDVLLLDEPTAPEGPVIRLRLISLMGGIHVIQGSRKRRREQLNR
jgi:hypothetical protein